MLEIVQNEEYLAAADLNVIKRRIGAITSATSRNESQIASIPSEYHEGIQRTFGRGIASSTKSRPKRQAAGAQFISVNSTVGLMPLAVVTGGALLVTISGLPNNVFIA